MYGMESSEGNQLPPSREAKKFALRLLISFKNNILLGKEIKPMTCA